MPILEEVFDFIYFILDRLFDFIFGSSTPKPYKAKFISEKSVTRGRNRGFCLSGKRALSVEHSYRNAMIIGGTGTGKSSVVLLPSLYSMQGSFVVHDPSGELYIKCAGYLNSQGYTLKVLNFSDPNSSDGYNPLHRAQYSGDINKVASLLIRTSLGGARSDPFWNLQATSLLSLLIHLVKTQKATYHNLASVRHLLSLLRTNPDEIDMLLKKAGQPWLYTEYKSFQKLDEKVQAGVVATCQAALQIFTDQSVALITSIDTVDFQSLRSRKTALFIQNPVADGRYYAVISALFLEQLFSSLLNHLPKKSDQDIFFLIDEASSIYLPSLSTVIANIRKYRGGILLALQDFNQLVHTYGVAESETIKSNCFAKLYFAGQSLSTASELESMLGLTEYTDDSGKYLIRPLITKDEIRTLEQNQALLLAGNNQPMKINLTPYYTNRKYLEYSNWPAPNRKRIVPDKLSPLVPSLPATNQANHE